MTPTYSLGARMAALTTGSSTLAIFPPGNSLGFVTVMVFLSSVVTS